MQFFPVKNAHFLLSFTLLQALVTLQLHKVKILAQKTKYSVQLKKFFQAACILDRPVSSCPFSSINIQSILHSYADLSAYS